MSCDGCPFEFTYRLARLLWCDSKIFVNFICTKLSDIAELGYIVFSGGRDRSILTSNLYFTVANNHLASVAFNYSNIRYILMFESSH